MKVKVQMSGLSQIFSCRRGGVRGEGGGWSSDVCSSDLDRLSGLFDALRDYWREELIDESQSTDERALADLQLPSRSSRICYFAVPIELLSWYREFIFPEVERFGFVPLAARDILTPSGTSTTKIDALINRAALIVAEITGRKPA